MNNTQLTMLRQRVGTNPRGKGQPPYYWSAFAALHREKFAEDPRHVIVLMAEALDTSVTTIRNSVYYARKKGIIEPTTQGYQGGPECPTCGAWRSHWRPRCERCRRKLLSGEQGLCADCEMGSV